jgi:hypothetical protein
MMKEPINKPTKPELKLDLDKLRELTPTETTSVVGAGGGARCTLSGH